MSLLGFGVFFPPPLYFDFDPGATDILNQSSRCGQQDLQERPPCFQPDDREMETL